MILPEGLILLASMGGGNSICRRTMNFHIPIILNNHEAAANK